MEKEKHQPVEKLAPELLWWENLSDEEAIQAQKNAGIYGHDQGVTHSDILEMWKDDQPVEKEPETAEQDARIENLNRCYNKRVNNKIQTGDGIFNLDEANGYNKGFYDGWKAAIDWQKQQSK